MRRRSPWKLLGGLALLLGLLAVAFFTWIQAVAVRRGAEMAERIHALLEEARSRPPRRVPLRGDPVPGDAWEDYLQACARVTGGKAMSDYLRGPFFRSDPPKLDPSAAKEALASNAESLELLRSGARKENGVYRVAFEKGFNAQVPGFFQAQELVTAARLQARFWREEGKSGEAVELLLDAARFGSDYGRNSLVIGEMCALALLGEVFEELKEIVGDPGEVVDWPALGLALEKLDGSFPDHGEAERNSALATAAGLLDPKSMDEVNRHFGWKLRQARFGFSRQLLMLDAVERQLDAAARVDAASRAPWPAAKRELLAIHAEVKACGNPILIALISGSTGPPQSARFRLAQLRLLRAAVAARAGEALPDLPDPFGDKVKGDGHKVWSAGPDGIDGGGEGDWKGAKSPDLVLELPLD